MKIDWKVIFVSLALLGVCSKCPGAVADSENLPSQPKGSTEDGAKVTPLVAARLDKFLDAKYAEGNMVGFGFEVIEHGHVVYRRTLGKADLQSGKPVTARTVFGLASITKTFTALALLYYDENHTLSFRDPITKYLKGVPSQWNKITVLELASMTGGFPHDVERQDMPWKEQYELIKHRPLDFAPNTKFQYSNIGYRLLGNIIESLSGRSYLDVVRDVVLKPFDMSSTGTVEQALANDNLATPYVKRGNSFVAVKYKPSTANFSAGMLASNLIDMSNYASGLLENRFPRSSSYQHLWFDRPPLADGTANPWAFGWGHKSEGNGLPERDSMTGALPGVSSSIICCPQDRIGIVSLSNVRSKTIANIAPQALRIIYNLPGNPETKEPEPSPIDDPHGI